MKTFVIKYLDDMKMETAYMQGNSVEEVKKEFEAKKGILADEILSISDIHQKSDDYSLSILMSKIVAFVGWIAVLGGLILFVTSLYKGGLVGGLLSSGYAWGTVAAGLLMILAGQTARAVLDTANYSRKILEEMRRIQ